MSIAAHRRHGISGSVWGLSEPHLPGRAGSWGGKAKDNWLFINVVFWIARTVAPWQDLPADYGDWKNTRRRFCRWRDRRAWEPLPEQLVEEQGIKADPAPFPAVVQIRCIALWAKIL